MYKEIKFTTIPQTEADPKREVVITGDEIKALSPWTEREQEEAMTVLFLMGCPDTGKRERNLIAHLIRECRYYKAEPTFGRMRTFLKAVEDLTGSKRAAGLREHMKDFTASNEKSAKSKGLTEFLLNEKAGRIIFDLSGLPKDQQAFYMSAILYACAELSQWRVAKEELREGKDSIRPVYRVAGNGNKRTEYGRSRKGKKEIDLISPERNTYKTLWADRKGMLVEGAEPFGYEIACTDEPELLPGRMLTITYLTRLITETATIRKDRVLMRKIARCVEVMVQTGNE